MSIWRIWRNIALVVCGVIFFSVGVMYVTGNISMLTAPFRGKVAETERVQADPGYRMANRDFFYSTCGDIKAKNQRIELLEQQVETASGDRKEQLQGALDAEQLSKQDLVEDYNAKAQNQNRGAFRDSALPYNIDASDMDLECE